MNTRRFVIVPSLLLASLSTSLCAQIATIGTSADCTHQWHNPDTPALQSALASGATTIRLTADVTIREAVSLTNRSVEIAGGYASCQAAAADVVDADARTSLHVPGNLQRPISILAISADPHTVRLRRLRITDVRPYHQRQPVSAGGGLAAAGNVDLELRDSDLVNLDASQRGGGIFLGAGIRTELHNVQMIGNWVIEATDIDAGGGGVYCHNADLLIDAHSRLLGNRAVATAHGGGIHSSGCIMNVYTRKLPGHQISGPGFDSNEAGGDGGAIFARDNSIVHLRGSHRCQGHPGCDGSTPGHALVMNNNKAGVDNPNPGHGGAIALSNSVLLANQIVLRNNAARLGGAIAVREGSTAYIGPTDVPGASAFRERECWSATHCNWLYANAAEDGHELQRFGGAVHVHESTLVLNQVRIEGNIARFGTAVVVRGMSAPARVEIRNSYLVRNQADSDPEQHNYVIAVNGNHAELIVDGSTITDNQVGLSQLQAAGTATIELNNSILHENGRVPLVSASANVSFFGVCNIGHEALPTPGTTLVVPTRAQMHFVDASAGDYRLLRTSPAVDRCNAVAGPYNHDFFGQRRGVRLGSGVGPNLDTGAHETLDGERIFANGFWSGSP